MAVMGAVTRARLRRVVERARDEQRTEEERRAAAAEFCTEVRTHKIASRLGPKFIALIALATGEGAAANERGNAAMVACRIVWDSGVLRHRRTYVPDHDPELDALLTSSRYRDEEILAASRPYTDDDLLALARDFAEVDPPSPPEPPIDSSPEPNNFSGRRARKTRPAKRRG